MNWLGVPTGSVEHCKVWSNSDQQFWPILIFSANSFQSWSFLCLTPSTIMGLIIANPKHFPVKFRNPRIRKTLSPLSWSAHHGFQIAGWFWNWILCTLGYRDFFFMTTVVLATGSTIKQFYDLQKIKIILKSNSKTQQLHDL